jgi:transposase, IS5 family
MRRKKEAVLCFQCNDEGLPKVIRDYRARYRVISQVLDKNSESLDLVHQDLKRLSQGDRKGRKGDFTSENILRALIVQDMEGLPFREAVIRIGGDGFLQDFLRTRKKAVMDFTFLNKCSLAIRPETWKRVNELLGRYGVARGVVNPKVIRADTTVMEANIHYPTDCSLLWDTWRVAVRLLKRAREIAPESVPHRFHSRKIKKLYLYITRYSKSKSAKRQQQVRGWFRTLIERVEWIVAIAAEFCRQFRSSVNFELAAVALELWSYLPSMQQVVNVARRVQVQGERVPAHQKVFSIFEPHSELIQRGRREKPVEFGHKVLLCQTAEKFITDYEVYEHQAADNQLTEPVIRRHEQLFGERPVVLAADKGFCPEKRKFEELAKLVENLAIPRRMQDFMDKVLAHCQAFRAGIEGTISGLKRAFRWFRCFFRGFRGFARNVGLGVFCHNLIVLAEQGSG